MIRTSASPSLIDIADRHVVCRLRNMSSPMRLVLILPSRWGRASLHASERSGKKAFQNAWMGRSVVVKRALYSVVYRRAQSCSATHQASGSSQRTHRGDADRNLYYQFDARRNSEKDIIDRDPNGIVSAMRKQYFRSMHLDIGTAQDVEPLMLVHYSPGVALIVRKVQIDRDRVRLYFHKDGKAELATTLTVKFPTPLSNELTESPLIDDAITRFVIRK